MAHRCWALPDKVICEIPGGGWVWDIGNSDGARDKQRSEKLICGPRHIRPFGILSRNSEGVPRSHQTTVVFCSWTKALLFSFLCSPSTRWYIQAEILPEVRSTAVNEICWKHMVL